jgi:hypothetical protein
VARHERVKEPTTSAAEPAAARRAASVVPSRVAATPAAVAAMQARAGNRAVTRWLARAPAGRTTERMLQRWDSPEHVSLGDTAAGPGTALIVLAAHDRDLPNRRSAPGSWVAPWAARWSSATAEQRRAMTDGLTYGEVLALSGDFYRGWDALNNAPLWEVITLIALIRGHPTTTDLQEATGGRYLALATQNVEHFSNVAVGRRNVDVWRRMHIDAIAEARAGRTNTAWGINGMADHYLTDAFAGGHIRTPRDRLTGSAMGNIQSKILHDLDNQFGVRVSNARGDTPWIAYGDEHFFTPENVDNRRLTQEAVRLSRQDVTDTLAGGSPAATGVFAAERLVPHPVDPAADRWTGREPTYVETRDGTAIRMPDDYTAMRDAVIRREGPGVVSGFLADDDQVRQWVADQDLAAIGRQPPEEKIRLIETLIGGFFSWISDDDVDAMVRILRSVTSRAEMQRLRRTLAPRALDFTSIGQRTRFRIALSREPALP